MAKIATLETRLEANILKFEEKMKRVDRLTDGVTDRIKRKHDAAQDSVAKVWGKANIGDAVGNVFGDLNGKALEGSRALGVFGSSLSALGVAGVAAGAVLGGVAVSIQQALGAMAYADEIGDTANKLGITTDALQELDYMAIKAGGSVEEFRSSIGKANVNLGAFQSGLADGKVKKFFTALGITKEEAAEFNNIYEMLPLLADRIKAVGSEAQQAEFAKRLGMEGLLPALKAGGDELRNMQQEAHALGLIIDSDMIAKAGELQDELDVAAKVVDMNLKRAFVDLAPIIVGVIQKVAQLAIAIADASESMRGLDNFSKGHLERRAGQVRGRKEYWEGVLAREPGNKTAQSSLKKYQDEYLEIGRNYQQYMKPAAAPKATDTASTVRDYSAGASGKSGGKKSPEKDRSEEIARASEAAMEAAARGELQARLAVTKAVEAEHEIRLQMLAAEYADKNARLDQDVAEKRITEASARIAKSSNERAEADERRLLDQQKAEKLEARNLEKLEMQASITERILAAQLAVANTAAGQRAIEDQMFKDRQEVERRLYAAKLKQAEYTEAEIAKMMADFDRAQKEEAGAHNGRPKGPLDEWRRSVADIDTQLESMAANGLDSFTDGLVDAALRTKDLGDVFANVADQIISDLMRIGVQKMITVPLAEALFGGSGGGGGSTAGSIAKIVGSLFGGGRAAGGPVSPGQIYRINENGQEYFAPTTAGKIIPAGQLGVPGGASAGGAPSITINHTVNANDAVLAGQVQEWIAQGSIQALNAARRVIPQDMARAAKDRFPR